MSASRAQIVDPDGPTAGGTPIAAYTDRVLDDQTVVATYPGYTAGDPLPEALDVLVTITWTTFDRRQRSLTLRGSTTR